MADRAQQNLATQELLQSIREEILSTTKLPMAIDFLASELRLAASSAGDGQFVALFHAVSDIRRRRPKTIGPNSICDCAEILHREALYRAEGISPRHVPV